MKIIPRGLYGITSPEDGTDAVDSVKRMIDAGAGIIQYRDKETDNDSFVRNAERIMGVCERNGTLFVVNDRYPVAKKLSAALQVGQEDESPESVRADGFENILGYSVNCEEFRRAREEGTICRVDYLGLGPVFSSGVKPGRPIIEQGSEREGIRKIIQVLEQPGLPVFLIGGIRKHNIGYVLELEPHGICLMSYRFRDSPGLVSRIVHEYETE